MFDGSKKTNKKSRRRYTGPERREHPREPQEAYERFLWWQCKNEKERYPSY